MQIGCVKSRRKNLLKMKTWNKWKVCKILLLILCSAMLVEGSLSTSMPYINIILFVVQYMSFVSNILGVYYVKGCPGSRGLKMMIPRFGCSGWCSVRCWQEPNFCGGDEMSANGGGVVGAFWWFFLISGGIS